MSEKNLRRSLFFLSGVAVLYLINVLVGGGSGQAPAGDPALTEVLANIDGASLERVRISGPGDSVSLQRAGEQWTVNGFPADSGAVARLQRAIDEAAVAAVAANNPANHARLGVSEDSAWTLLAVDGDGISSLLLGKAGSRFRTAYARLPGEDVVSTIEGDLRAAAVRPLFDWRDKTVLSVDTSAVATIEIARDGNTTVYERQDSAWMVAGAGADATTLRNILQELAGLRASGFAPDSAVMPTPSSRSVLAADAAGAELVFLSLDERDGNFWVMSSQSPYIFEIPAFRADRVAPALADEEGTG